MHAGLPSSFVDNLTVNKPVNNSAFTSNWFARTFDPQGESMRFNAYESAVNRRFQERMSNTAYQRAVADMRGAGLNPYALYSSASPASVPSGSVGSVGGGSNAQAVAGLVNLAFSAFTAGSKFAVANKLAMSSLRMSEAEYLKHWLRT